MFGRRLEGVHDVGGFEDGAGVRGDAESSVVVDDVDLDVGDVGLPAFVGKRGLAATPWSTAGRQ